MLQKPQLVGNAALAFSQSLGGLFLSQMIALHQKADPLGLFHKVQILPLEIFNEGNHPALPVAHAHDDAGHLTESGKFCCPEPPFPSDELIAGVAAPYGKGLQHPVAADALGKLLQTLVGE